MRQTILIVLLTFFAILITSTAVFSQETLKTSSASVSQTIAPAKSGGSDTDDVCEQRLLKALDTLEKAERALSSSLAENQSRIQLDKLKDQWIAVKDSIIQEQAKLISLLQSTKKGDSIKSRILQILKIAEKAAMIATGILIGRGL